MNDLFAFYKSRISNSEQILNSVKKRLLFLSMLRLLIFLLGVFVFIFFFGKPLVFVPILLVFSLIFVFLVGKQGNVQVRKDLFSNLVQINKREIEVLERNFSDLPDGLQFADSSHYFSQDIDLFGKNSFFQYINRSGLREGKQRLAAMLTSNDIQHIEKKQNAVMDLAEKVDFRQRFLAKTIFVKKERSEEKVLTIFENYNFSIPEFARWLPLVFSISTLILASGWYWNFFPAYVFLIWGGIGLVSHKLFSKRINLLGEKVGAFQNSFENYHHLLKLIEKEHFTAELLRENHSKIFSGNVNASVLLKRFSKNIDSFEQRNIFLFGALANIFFLWDLHYARRLETWIKEHAKKIPQWVGAVQYLDAYNSLGNFSFNHPHYVFPKIENGNTILNSKRGGHPLIDPAKNVLNDYCIEKGQFFIITGANMAGKSTFLRSVSLQIVMANVGLPVCAEKCSYSPIKLITSMRSTDSLSEGASYFYSELTRLKFIVDKLKTDRYFIVLDEILKGTNSQDKALGSRKFVEKLIASRSTGIIATHDLSLCETASSSNEIKNFYFDVEIVGNELYFDYTIHEGVCKNMNASFLLKQMGIVD